MFDNSVLEYSVYGYLVITILKPPKIRIDDPGYCMITSVYIKQNPSPEMHVRFFDKGGPFILPD